MERKDAFACDPTGDARNFCMSEEKDERETSPTAELAATIAVPSETDAEAAAQAVRSAEAQTELAANCKKRRVRSGFQTADIAKIAVLTAMSYILYLFVKFSLPMIFPGFLDMQFSDLPALIAGFSMGPAQGCFVILAKCLLKMPMSTTSYIGEVGDILIGIAFVLPATLIYRYRKCKKNAVIGLLVGIASSVAMALIVNRTLLIPFYGKVFGFDALVNMVGGLYPGVTTATFYNYYLWLAVLPFNVLRCAICGILTYLIYKPLSKIMHWEMKEKEASKTKIRTADVMWQIASVLFPFAGIGVWIYDRKRNPAQATRILLMTVVGFAIYVAIMFLLLVYFGKIKL